MTKAVRRAYELGPGFSYASRLRGPYTLAYAKFRDLVVHNLRTGRRRRLYEEGPGRSACPLAWSPDGRTLFHSHQGEVIAVDVATGTPKTLTSFGADGERPTIYWQLHCSPDGSRLLFLRMRDLGGGSKIYSASTETGEVHEVCSMERLWNFACSWQHDLLLATIFTGKEPALWRMDLEGRNAQRISQGWLPSELQIAADGEHAVYELQSGVWSLDLRTGDTRRVVEWGSDPALSPDGARVAFKREEHDLHVQTIGGPVETILVGGGHDDRWRGGSWMRAPLWSPDGRLLLFSTTISERHPEPLNPEHVASLRKAKAEAARNDGFEERRGLRVRVDYDIAIENAHWSFQHSMGLVDFHTREVWMREGYWQNAAWAPR
jgi:Tol biopolymer transport system component